MFIYPVLINVCIVISFSAPPAESQSESCGLLDTRELTSRYTACAALGQWRHETGLER